MNKFQTSTNKIPTFLVQVNDTVKLYAHKNFPQDTYRRNRCHLRLHWETSWGRIFSTGPTSQTNTKEIYTWLCFTWKRWHYHLSFYVKSVGIYLVQSVCRPVFFKNSIQLENNQRRSGKRCSVACSVTGSTSTKDRGYVCKYVGWKVFLQGETLTNFKWSFGPFSLVLVEFSWFT